MIKWNGKDFLNFAGLGDNFEVFFHEGNDGRHQKVGNCLMCGQRTQNVDQIRGQADFFSRLA